MYGKGARDYPCRRVETWVRRSGRVDRMNVAAEVTENHVIAAVTEEAAVTAVSAATAVTTAIFPGERTT